MLELTKFKPKDLKPGMFVSSLDRPWLGTPFLVQGITVDSDEDIAQLDALCEYVFVDLQRSEVRETKAPGRRKASSDGATQSSDDSAEETQDKQPDKTPKKRRRLEKSEYLEGRTLTPYVDKSDWDTEYPEAIHAVGTLSESAFSVFEKIEAGSGLDLASIKRSVTPMIDSIARNPDACIWLTRLKKADDYTYRHSVACSIWAVVMGRQLGLTKEDLQSLAIGGLLLDVGKLKVNEELLKSPKRLSGLELEEVRQHVTHGAKIAAADISINEDISAMILQHHERYDGNGYPARLPNKKIHVFARIAGIVDCYDALTSHRSYAPAISPSQAIKHIHTVKDIEFQAELVEEFTQAVGIYPAGTIVELSSGEVAVVVSEYRSRRLRPRVVVLLDAGKNPLKKIRSLDLLQRTHDADGKPLDIVTSLPPGAHGIELDDLGF